MLIRLANVFERINLIVGHSVAWLMLATALITFATVYFRYVLGIGLIWLQESYVWTHAAAIMLGSAFALLSGGFIRVDMLQQRMSAFQRALVEILGTLLFLFPFSGMLLFYGWPFFHRSWRMLESSAYEGGLPAIYLLKGMLLVFAVLLILQGMAMLLRNLCILVNGASNHVRTSH